MPVGITDTTLRDAHQSLWATRMLTEDMVPILKQIDGIGYFSAEVWGGATFDASLRFLDENPWDRLRVIKKHMQRTPLQMLLRGQNLVGYRHYSDDLVRRFVKASVDNGMDIFRNFDALNDTRNLKSSFEAIKEFGGHASGAVVYTISPVHTLDHYVETALEMVEMGVDSICIKDMAALLTPARTEKLVRKLKSEIDLPLIVHCHYIGGMAPMNYWKAIEAGADVIDTATVPIAFGNSQPATEMIVAALKETPFDTRLDLNKLYDIAEYFEQIRVRRQYKRGVTSLAHMRVFSHQVPGGMISNLISQLEQQGAVDRLDEVLEEIPRVRAEVGFPPLVTPLSQIVGTQAVLNVLTGKRWGLIPGEMKNYIKGLYGKAPGPVDPDIAAKVLGDLKPITHRPADDLTETFDGCAKEIGDLARTEEDVLMYALFPNEARAYLEKHQDGVEDAVFMAGVRTRTITEGDDVDVEQIKELVKLLDDSQVGEIVVEEGETRVQIRRTGMLAQIPAQSVAPSDPIDDAPAASDASKVDAHERPDSWKKVVAPMVGTVYRSPSPDAAPYVEVDDSVDESQTLCIVEAMKLMNEIPMEERGVIKEIAVENGEAVEYGQVLFWYEPLG